ncbi:MAG: hypothetical protein ABJE10_06620 [bacterium]
MTHHMNVRTVIGTLIVLAVTPGVASAQFGMLKKLKNSISPDSAAKVEAAKEDSIALAVKLAAGDTTPLERSKFSRMKSAAGSASDKFESVTGVSAKDAALAATGIGASGLIAKKMGVDPVSLGAKALVSRQQSMTGQASGIAGLAGLRSGGGLPGIPGMPNVAELLKLQQTAALQMQNAPKGRANTAALTGNPMAGFSEADAKALAAFQTEMMQVAMAASNGDVAAQARLERWQTIALKYQPEIEKLSMAGSAGDMAAIQRLQVIQVEIVKEWAGTASLKPAKVVKPLTTKAKKP